MKAKDLNFGHLGKQVCIYLESPKKDLKTVVNGFLHELEFDIEEERTVIVKIWLSLENRCFLSLNSEWEVSVQE